MGFKGPYHMNVCAKEIMAASNGHYFDSLSFVLGALSELGLIALLPST